MLMNVPVAPTAFGTVMFRKNVARPDCAAAAFQPIVEQDARDLPSLARPCTVAQEPATAKADSI